MADCGPFHLELLFTDLIPPFLCLRQELALSSPLDSELSIGIDLIIF